jgi:hypothetical protein
MARDRVGRPSPAEQAAGQRQCGGVSMARSSTGQRMDMATLWWGVVFGAVGLGFFIYGKRQGAFVPLLCGIGLMVFPYFVANAWATVAIGAVLMAIPYFVRL